MCVGRSPAEALDVMMDALPTALGADLVLVSVPGPLAQERAAFGRKELDRGELEELKAARATGAAAGVLRLPRIGELRYFEAELPVGGERGLLLAARRTPLEPDVDRVLVRSAANLVGTALEAANVLEAAQRKDEFLARLGHELRNPLAALLTAAERLGRIPAATREQEVIDRYARHLSRLVDDLLDISRVTQGHVELRDEHVSLASVLERAVDLVMPALSRFRHELEVSPAGNTMIRGDSVRLAQVFSNLLGNAAKFTPAGGKLQLLVEPREGRVVVRVRDNGRGISREALARIFEPFVQLDVQSDRQRAGLGLGLAIAKDLVIRHGGSITAESDGPEKGATFTVNLPVIPAAEARAPVPERRPPQPREGVRVLVVDDNIDVAQLLSEALQEAGFETAVAFDAEAAIELWRRFVPDAAVLDVGLPGIDGYDLARALRAEYGARPMLIAATGYGQRSDRLRAAEVGFDRHLTKPFSIRDLLVALDERTRTAPPS
ncbi:MAG TPA: hybrid sensor histidine kinase/response regulator [Polyangiaceae bacterium]